ncbi:Protein of unknown function (DUF1769) [Geosmithia morbida]|uniref:Domain of unknown function at the cortex 1 domain-containing protein n=1 Tax=Geosmithia morbida TaxID=1094350 RepID=A0A9P5CYG3_9HYPO|nr:Protein of unknown function (DUF1769) [Geosmithia morbida]KAF4120393.1 Protein of unknown function (DUF1769) [Geosmithia morbida]
MEHYTLLVTAGPGYDVKDHVQVAVNDPKPIRISSDLADIDLNVRIKDYNGLPKGSPSTSPYFESGPHADNNDQYSLCFRFTPKAPQSPAKATKGEQDPALHAEAGISGFDLQFGNDFDRPVRDWLPPGFNAAMRIVRWWIDPGLEGDAYADNPHLYGPVLSSVNVLNVGLGDFDESKGGLLAEEGGDTEPRKAIGMPEDSQARMKWALNDDVKKQWVFKYGDTYTIDFFNPYLDFSTFSLRLPGFSLPLLSYLKSRGVRRIPYTLRYVLRNRATGDVYLAICFSLHLSEDVAEDGTIEETIDSDEDTQDDHAKTVTDAGSEQETAAPAETSADDVD